MTKAAEIREAMATEPDYPRARERAMSLDVFWEADAVLCLCWSGGAFEGAQLLALSWQRPELYAKLVRQAPDYVRAVAAETARVAAAAGQL